MSFYRPFHAGFRSELHCSGEGEVGFVRSLALRLTGRRLRRPQLPVLDQTSGRNFTKCKYSYNGIAVAKVI